MVLCDRDIRKALESGRIGVDPLDFSMVQPASLDICMGNSFRVFHNARFSHIDLKKPVDELTRLVEISDDEAYMLNPGEFVLGRSVEMITLPDDLVARLEGKSSLGRVGLIIHATAGFIDPGFSGTVTLELSNNSNLPISLYPNMPIGQLSFMEMTGSAEHPYGDRHNRSKYQGQTDPTSSRMHENFGGRT